MQIERLIHILSGKFAHPLQFYAGHFYFYRYLHLYVAKLKYWYHQLGPQYLKAMGK